MRIIKSIINRTLPIVCRNVQIDNIHTVSRLLKVIYLLKCNRRLNLNKPKTFTEKIQAYKLWINGKGYERYVDKLRVQSWITSILGEEYVIPVIRIWEKAEDITFDKLPLSFVLKTNHGAGMNLIIHDKSKIEIEKVRKEVRGWLSTNYCVSNGFEYQYRNIEPRIYAETIVKDKDGKLQEYKFLCFNGKPYYCIVDMDRFSDHRRNVYNMQWELENWTIGNYSQSPNIDKPASFDKMVEIATILCKDFSMVRVDLYNVDGRIYFSELTLTPGSGYSLPKPYSADLMLGDLWAFNSEGLWKKD